MSTALPEIGNIDAALDYRRLRHIVVGDLDNLPRPLIALCGSVLPQLPPGLASDRGPAGNADCIVCRDLAISQGIQL